MFKINTEKELYNFLKILTEESVKKSKKLLNEEEDPYNSFYLNSRKKEKKMFEQDVDVEEPAPEKEKSQEQPSDQKNISDQEPSDEIQSEDEKFVASKDRLVDFVNDIRSAPSIKDSAVSEQINDYYDRLTQEEKDVLVFFLRELSRVMTGKASGKNARDPSDPPLSIEFVQKGEEAPKEPEESPEQPEEAAPDDALIPDTESELSAEEEDTTAPIKVNESQDHTALREKIRNLLL